MLVTKCRKRSLISFFRLWCNKYLLGFCGLCGLFLFPHQELSFHSSTRNFQKAEKTPIDDDEAGWPALPFLRPSLPALPPPPPPPFFSSPSALSSMQQCCLCASHSATEKQRERERETRCFKWCIDFFKCLTSCTSLTPSVARSLTHFAALKAMCVLRSLSLFFPLKQQSDSLA